MTDTRAELKIPDLITAKRGDISALCREYGIIKLEVFGSVMTDEFDAERSDIDFIAYFAPGEELGWWADEYYGLLRKLSKLLGREVDLVEPRALNDPFFRHVAKMTRTVIYDGSTEAEIRASA